VHIEYQINRDDYLSAATLVLRKRSSLTAFRYYWPYIFATFWMATIFLPIVIGGHPRKASDPLLLYGILPGVIAIMWVRRFWLGREFRRSTNLQLPHVFDADSNGIQFVTEHSDHKTSWQYYSRYLENSRVFLLFQKGNQVFLIIPKRALTADQLVGFRNLLNSQLRRK
jgi:hypothetical protein